MECREGLRRYPGTTAGDNYQAAIAHGGEGDFREPSVAERTIGDLLDPRRPGRVVDLVNAAARETGLRVEGWRVDRLLSMVSGLEAEARERERAES